MPPSVALNSLLPPSPESNPLLVFLFRSRPALLTPPTAENFPGCTLATQVFTRFSPFPYLRPPQFHPSR